MAQTRQPARRPAGAFLSRAVPPPALCGFLLLLVVVFAASYAVGRGAGPVAPGMHGTTPGGSGGGGTDMGDMDMGHGGGR